MSGACYVRFYPTDWRAGCMGLSLEQEGLYIRMCAYIFETGRRIPRDASQAAKFMGVHTNAYTKVHGQLLALGKIQEHADGWSVRRAETELAAAVKQRKVSDQNGAAERQADTQRRRNAGPDTLGVTPPDTPIDTPLDTMGVFSENDNEISTPLIDPVASSQEPVQEPPNPPLGAFDDPANHDGVVVTEAGTVRLINGTRQFWLNEFGGDAKRLDLALLQVSIQPNSRVPVLAQIGRQLGKQAAEKYDRDVRYQSAAAANQAKAKKKPFDLTRMSR